MLDFLQKKYYNVNDLLKIMSILRSDDGCLWDKEQTHKSIRNNFIEEVYEAVEAIDTDNSILLREELGDVLLQVVFHSQIASEVNTFCFDDVVNDICNKLIIRHPHVFGEVSAKNTSEILDNWEKIKNKVKGTENYTKTLTDVPKVLPALMRAEKIGKRAGKVGFDFENPDDSLLSLESEIAEVKNASLSSDKNELFEEIGDMLFACVNVSRKFGVSPEEALSFACEKFISRFEKVENLSRLDGNDLSSLSIDDLNSLWDKAKK